MGRRHDGGPVAAGDARIELTFTGDGTSYDGHREIIEGRAEVTFINKTNRPVWLVIQRYDAGSAELADELSLVQEGGSIPLPDGPLPDAVELNRIMRSGANRVEIALKPGTYIIDAGIVDAGSDRLWCIEPPSSRSSPTEQWLLSRFGLALRSGAARAETSTAVAGPELIEVRRRGRQARGNHSAARHAVCKLPDAGCRMPDAGCRMPDAD